MFELASQGAPGIDHGSIDLSPRAMYGIATVFLTITAPQPAFSERSHARQIRCIHIYSLYKKCGPEADRIAQNSNYRFSLHSIKATFGFVAHFY